MLRVADAVIVIFIRHLFPLKPTRVAITINNIFSSDSCSKTPYQLPCAYSPSCMQRSTDRLSHLDDVILRQLRHILHARRPHRDQVDQSNRGLETTRRDGSSQYSTA